MAAITITEILGGDNIAGSRLTINDNFKKLANGLNTIETLLNTSPAGGSLSIGNVQVLKYSRPVTDTLFTCQAAGQFEGGLLVSKDLGVSQSVNVALDLTVSRNITFASTPGGTPGSFTSSVSSKFNGQFGSTQMYAAQTGSAAVNPQDLTQTGNTTRNLASVTGYRVLRFNLSTYDTSNTALNCNTVVLPSVGPDNQGQILSIIVGTKSVNAMTNFTISSQNFAPGLTTGVVFSTPDSDIVLKRVVTVFGDLQGWRILSSSDVTIS